MASAEDEPAQASTTSYEPPRLVHYGTIEEWTLGSGPIVQVSIIV